MRDSDYWCPLINYWCSLIAEKRPENDKRQSFTTDKKGSRWDAELNSAWLNETKQASVILTIPYVIKDVLDERRRITCLTLFNLLTLGIAQASLALRSFNRKFQDLSAEKDKKGSLWNPELNSGWRIEWSMVRMTLIRLLCANSQSLKTKQISLLSLFK